MMTTGRLLSPIPLLLAASLAFAGDKHADKSAGKAGNTPTPAPDAAAAGAIAIVAGEPIPTSALDALASPRLRDVRAKEYEIKRQALDELVSQSLFDKEAKARGITRDELLAQELGAKIAPVTDEEVKTFYEQNVKGRYNGKEEDLLGQVKTHLQQQRQGDRRGAFVKELQAKYAVRIMLQPPRVPIEAAGPSRGPNDAPVTIVEFSDFQCPFCGRVEPTLKQLHERYGDKIRLVFRDFPLPGHAQAPKASEAAACASEQGKFWEMHDKLFANQSALQVDDLKKRAVELELNAEQFNQCLDSGKHQDDWKKNMEAGNSAGVSGTPAFFINGRLLSGAKPYDEFAKVIEEELQQAGIPVPPAPAPKAAPAAEAPKPPSE
jgi:protein-disulfide isomerase